MPVSLTNSFLSIDSVFILSQFDPELVLVSAGYDSSFVCPVGGSYLNTLSESIGHTFSALLDDPMKPINPRNGRDKCVSEGNNAKKYDLATRVRAWVKTDLDIQISMDAVKYHLSHFMDSRKTLCGRLCTIEAKIKLPTRRSTL
ncbi:unnamed protein product [Schistosoma mattheei]|uniref:Histone deacetylase domain-containing protein n=1 Tax=Schistosoma mattheei TaxID=31246 RepID=A0AA85AVU4_9TREM|nr:unnamed protein product [Schistosoma mattheei]